MKQTIQQRILVHDRYQVQMKHFYRLQPTDRTEYRITTYMFLPQSLGVNHLTFAPSDFYKRIQNYFRLKTPQLDLDELLENPRSPLVRMLEILANDMWRADAPRRKRLSTSLKFTRATVKECLDRQLQQMVPDQQPTDSAAGYVGARAEQMMAGMTEIARTYRTGAEPLMTLVVDDDLRRDYRLTDESISLVLEESYLRSLDLINRYVTGKEHRRLRQQIGVLVQSEIDYRKEQGYQSILQPEGDNEDFLYRSSALKKFTSSVLYLSTSVSLEGTMLEQVLFAIAAGISMVFATVVAFYFQNRFGRFTFPVFIALVVGYMFKDRIKESGRALALRLLRTVLYDRRITVQTSDRVHDLGYLREKMVFVTQDELPVPVKAVRRQGFFTELEGDGQDESVIAYTKTVTLYPQMFTRIYPGGPEITGVNDIMRLDVRPFLHKMANPVQRKPMLRKGKIRLVRCRKVYRVYFVIVIQNDEHTVAPTYTWSMLTLDRKGIVRVETGPPSPAPVNAVAK